MRSARERSHPARRRRTVAFIVTGVVLVAAVVALAYGAPPTAVAGVLVFLGGALQAGTAVANTAVVDEAREARDQAREASREALEALGRLKRPDLRVHVAQRLSVRDTDLDRTIRRLYMRVEGQWPARDTHLKARLRGVREEVTWNCAEIRRDPEGSNSGTVSLDVPIETVPEAGSQPVAEGVDSWEATFWDGDGLAQWRIRESRRYRFHGTTGVVRSDPSHSATNEEGPTLIGGKWDRHD